MKPMAAKWPRFELRGRKRRRAARALHRGGPEEEGREAVGRRRAF
jgi:hypothetical protein